MSEKTKPEQIKEARDRFLAKRRNHKRLAAAAEAEYWVVVGAKDTLTQMAGEHIGAATHREAIKEAERIIDGGDINE